MTLLPCTRLAIESALNSLIADPLPTEVSRKMSAMADILRAHLILYPKSQTFKAFLEICGKFGIDFGCSPYWLEIIVDAVQKGQTGEEIYDRLGGQ